jgi:hypothetical protein
MRSEKIKQLDLSKVEDCRWYLKNFKLRFKNGETRKVTEAVLKDGKKVQFSDLSDSQAVQYANQLYEDLELRTIKAGMN